MSVINFFILINASFFPSQKNIIEMALFIDRHSQIKTIYNLEKTLEWIPEKFIFNNQNYSIVDLTLSNIKDQIENNCQAVVIANDFILQQQRPLLDNFKIIATFDVNWIESLAYRFNKKNNIRRAPLHVLSNCKSKATQTH